MAKRGAKAESDDAGASDASGSRASASASGRSKSARSPKTSGSAASSSKVKAKSATKKTAKTTKAAGSKKAAGATKKTAATKKSTTKASSTKKVAATSKTATKKVAAKKAAGATKKKAVTKKVTGGAAKKATAKTTSATKKTTKKTPTTKTKKPAAKKTVTKKTPAKKAPARKSARTKAVPADIESTVAVVDAGATQTQEDLAVLEMEPTALPRLLVEVKATVTKGDLEAVLDAYDRVAETEFSFSNPPDLERGEVASDKHEDICRRAAEELALDLDTFRARWAVATLPFAAWDALEHGEETNIDYAKLRFIAAFELGPDLVEQAVQYAVTERPSLEDLHAKVEGFAQERAANRVEADQS